MLTLLPLLATLGCVDQAVTCEAPPGDGGGDPYSAGPYRVESSTLKLDVDSRRRARPLDLYLPQGREDAPLVVFHHGFAAPRSLYHRTACHLAGWGLATAMPQWDESFVFSQDHSELREDSLALLPALETLELLEQVDFDALGVAGHSRGGKQALFHALDDERVKAVFAIDPVDSGSPFGDPDPVDFPLVADSLADLEIPAGMIGAGRGGETFDGGVISAPCAPVEGNYEVLFDAATSPTTLWTLPEAGHSDFADPCAEDPQACEPCVAGADPAQAREIAGALAVSFFRFHLEGAEEQEQWLTGSGLPQDVVLDQR